MFFAAPWALVGLLAAGLPLLLHLIQRHEADERVFPAVRYLEDATRDRYRRLALRHWLLLAVRTLLIVALVLAAAGATVRRAAFGRHLPQALVVVMDNGASSAAVIDGEPQFTALRRAADQVLDHATASDRVWLIAADGVARSGTAAELRLHLASLRPEPLRFDLGRAVSDARDLIRAAHRAGEVVVVSAVPRSGTSAARGNGALLVLRPEHAPPANRGVVMLSAGLQPWGPAGGDITVGVASSDTAPVPVTLSAGGHPLRDILVTPGVPAVQHLSTLPPGWTTLTASLPPDELRLDDAASVAVRVAPAPMVRWDSTDHFINVAASVLAADGRIRSGDGVRLGALGSGGGVVLPPSDPAAIGALNRTLASRGISWQFGSVVAGAGQADTGRFLGTRASVTRRYALERVGDGGDVLATVDGAPWVVRSGNLILLGSRLDTTWTALPLSSAFVPFLDALLTSTAPGAQVDATVAVGEPVRLPARVTAVIQDGQRTPLDATERWTPRRAGVGFVLAGSDTIGAVAARLDPRASTLARVTDAELRSLWPGATIAADHDGASLTFAAAGRGDLRGPLLLLALACVVAELLLTGRAARLAVV